MRVNLFLLMIPLAAQLASCRCSKSSNPLPSLSAPKAAILMESVSAQAAPSRETRLELKGIATLVVPPGALSTATTVSLKTTQSEDIAQTFEQTIGKTGPGSMRRAPYEIIVDTGKTAPKRNMSLTLVVPDSFRAGGSDFSARSVEVLVEYVSGSQYELHDSFSVVEARPSADSKVLLIELDPAAFAEINSVAGNYQAVVLLAGENPEPASNSTPGVGR